MNGFSYSQLHSFWMTAKAGSMTRAKERLDISQPALSLQLRQLETALGQKLYRRTRRGIALTEPGKIAFSHGEKIFAQGESLVRSLSVGKKAEPRIRVGVSPSLPSAMSLSLLCSIEEARGPVALELATASLAELARGLKEGRLDLAAAEEPFVEKSRRAGELTFRFVASPALIEQSGWFPKPRGPQVPLLLQRAGNPARRWLDSFLSPFKGRWTAAAQTDDENILRLLALRGKGAALLPEGLVSRELSEGRLLRLGQDGFSQTLWLAAGKSEAGDSQRRAVLSHMMTRYQLDAGITGRAL